LWEVNAYIEEHFQNGSNWQQKNILL
jgi:hypothetical protein